ncbi:MAG: hypothetical protein FJW68_09580 [Actinobacteria bacterium]|nr:hypothetical protein [Actinomycetota bacterium]
MPAIEYEIYDDADYLHTCAQLKAKEFEFLEKSRLERMIHSGSMEDFLKVLSESYYSNYINLITPENNLDGLILKLNAEIIEYLDGRLKPEHAFVPDLLMFEENIHNFKVLLKAFILKENLSSIFLPARYSYENLMEEISGQGFARIDDNTLNIAKFISSLKENQNIDLKDAEIGIEKKYIETLYSSIKQSSGMMMLDFIKHAIDIINIKNIVRVKHAGIKIDYESFLHKNGFLEVSILKKFGNENYDSILQALSSGDYGAIVSKGIRSLNNYETFFSFDKNEYIFYLSFFDKIKYSVANIEKIFSFFMRKKIEIKILNIIYLGLLYGVEKSKIEHKVEIISEN